MTLLMYITTGIDGVLCCLCHCFRYCIVLAIQNYLIAAIVHHQGSDKVKS